MTTASHKAKPYRAGGFSAGSVAKSSGRKYSKRTDARMTVTELRRAVDAACDRRGLNRGPLSPREAAGLCLYGNQGRYRSNP